MYFSNKTKIQGASTAIGTLANCSGGVTPWRSILTCEENYDMFYGELKYDTAFEHIAITIGILF